MIRVKINFEEFDSDTRWMVTNINGNFLGFLCKIDENKYQFIGEDWIYNVDTKEGDFIKSSMIINGSFEYAKEKVNMAVEKFINSFFEQE